MDPQRPNNSLTDPNGDRPTISKSGTVCQLSTHVFETSIDPITQGSKYKPGAEVYLSSSGSRTLTGPYLVASVASQGKYTLEDKDGAKANGGNVGEEKTCRSLRHSFYPVFSEIS